MQMRYFLVLWISLGLPLPSLAGGCSSIHGNAHDQCLVARDSARQQERAREAQRREASQRAGREQQQRAADSARKQELERQRTAQAERQRRSTDTVRQQQERATREEVLRNEQQRHNRELQARRDQDERSRSFASTGKCSDLHGTAHDHCLGVREAVRQQERARESQRREVSQRAEREQQQHALDSTRGRQAIAISVPAIGPVQPGRTTSPSPGVNTRSALQQADLPNKNYYRLNSSEKASFNAVVANAQKLRAQGDDQAARRVTNGLPPELRSIGNESVFGSARPAGPSNFDVATAVASPGKLPYTLAEKALLKKGVGEIESGLYRVIAGQGHRRVIDEEAGLIAEYGGRLGQWQKIVTRNIYRTAEGIPFQIHAYRNALTGMVVKEKLKILP